MGETSVERDVHSEHLQWEYRDGSRRFFIPDVAVAYPGARSRQELQDYVVLIVEVTSPDSPDTVANDFGVKPKRYAKNGVPFYLLVDQERGEWMLHSLIKDRPRYEVHSTGAYGKPIVLPEPFGFSIDTTQWPPYPPEAE
ncbi:Uma2 family endonuclease [Actinocrinis puniceicyclus]|uniref:Uma2 family endonuclease n=1 Tax=Actinocrinis puniceicyclus TaxID=977794 RepID=A0A8J8BED3_9ACTN|nr:Uma2 family endonuclease [Actinocrinis puniceicyclus]MBS2963654.1 Uma2 family endonuclease [Actinocrinis puniceicyclus]